MKQEKKTDSNREQNEKIFYFGKKNKEKLFTYMLECVKNDMYPLQIARYFSKKFSKKISKQRINYWLKLLLKHNLIRKDHRKPILTESGKRFLIHHEKPVNYSGHALEVSYTIKSIGDLPENNVRLKNWGYWKDRFFDVFIRVNRGKINKLMIYVPEVKSDTKHDLLLKMGEKLGMILSLIERQYRCEIDWDTREITRRLEVHTPNDPEGKVFEKEKINFKGKTIDINQSGHAHFDITEGNRSLEPFEAIERYDQMINDFPSIKNMLGGISQSNHQVFNLMAIQTETLKSLKNAITSILDRGGTFTPKSDEKRKETPKERLELPAKEGLNAFFKESEENTIHVETLDVIPSFVANRKGVLTEYPELNKGAKIWLPRSVARVLMEKRKARQL